MPFLPYLIPGKHWSTPHLYNFVIENVIQMEPYCIQPLEISYAVLHSWETGLTTQPWIFSLRRMSWPDFYGGAWIPSSGPLDCFITEEIWESNESLKIKGFTSRIPQDIGRYPRGILNGRKAGEAGNDPEMRLFKMLRGPYVNSVINGKNVQLLHMLEINKLRRDLSVNVRNEFQILLSILLTHNWPKKRIVCKFYSMPGKQSENPFNQIFWKAFL